MPALPRIVAFADHPDLSASVHDFNCRMAAKGYSEYHFSESPSSRQFPKKVGSQIWMEYFLVLDGSKVRGGYILKFQPFFCLGQPLDLNFLKLPISEGLVDPIHAPLGIQLLQDSVRRSPNLFALGMGGLNAKLPQLLRKMKWRTLEVPFFFQVCNMSNFLRNISFLKDRRLLGFVAKLTAITGLASVLGLLLNVLTSIKLHLAPPAQAEQVESFGEWTDQIWDDCKEDYGFLGSRTSEILNCWYSARDTRLIRLKITQNNTVFGWALAVCTQHCDHKYFGSMKVAAIVDCLSKPAHSPLVVQATTTFLRQLRPDLIISNQLHQSWKRSLAKSGYLRGPSNFALALSPKLSRDLDSMNISSADFHINRGDGDGPIHL